MAERESESTAFSLGKGARIGKIEVGGHVAGRDVVVGTTPAEASSAQDMAEALELLKRLEEEIAGLTEAPTVYAMTPKTNCAKHTRPARRETPSDWSRSSAPRRATWSGSVRACRPR